jgi:hypothetical protein
MGCPKNVVNCPDRTFSAKNAAKVQPVKISPHTALIGGKQYTITPKKP